MGWKMAIKTVDLGLPENLEKLNYLVGKIAGKDVEFHDSGCKENKNYGYPYYSPATNATQCLEATPKCEITVYGDNTWGAAIEGKPFLVNSFQSELLARCIALVYGVYGDEVPESEWEQS